MEDTKSKVVLNLYGKKIKAKLSCADPELGELIFRYVELLKRLDFSNEDINDALINHVLWNRRSSGIVDKTDSTSTNEIQNFFFDYITSKKDK